MRATLRENLAECWEHYIVSKTVAPELRVVELATKPDYDSAEVAALLD
ncbi:MAG: hypothetical protein HOK58_01830, partial [Acidimicrobiaceae bacterium]|nr:hypothetical protein [Acidimicrobiaceae bacterium]